MPYAEINGTTIYYEVKGSGTPLLLIHPPLLASGNFRYQLSGLSDRFRVIAFDIRGHGRSRYSKTPITYALIADDIVGLMDYLGIRQACIGGYSTGGSIALEAMLDYPERFIGGVMISGLSEVSNVLLKSEIWTAVRLSSFRFKRMLASAISLGNADSPETFRRLFREAVRGDIRNVREYYAYSLKYNCTAQLELIRQPMLLLYGAKDKGFYKYARLLNEHLPDSRLYFLPGVRHQLPTKAWARMNGLIEEWAEEKGIVGQQAASGLKPEVPVLPTARPEADEPTVHH